MCEHVEHTIFSRDAVVTVPMEVLVGICGFLYTDVIRKPLSPRETRVSKKGMDPSLLGTSVVNWMWRFKELRCKRNC